MNNNDKLIRLEERINNSNRKLSELRRTAGILSRDFWLAVVITFSLAIIHLFGSVYMVYKADKILNEKVIVIHHRVDNSKLNK